MRHTVINFGRRAKFAAMLREIKYEPALLKVIYSLSF